MQRIGVIISCETHDDISDSILLFANSFSFSWISLTSRMVIIRHCLLLKIKFWTRISTSFVFFYYV